MLAMIFAAGMGTRLKPITDTMPKALVPVGGRPLIEHVLRKLKASGISRGVVNVHHLADQIEEWVERQDIMELQISDEREMLLETGGAVLHARRYLEGCGSFLIHNVDILSDCDLRWFISQIREDALATLLVSDRTSSRYLLFNPQTMRLEGWVNVKTGKMRLAGPHVDPDRCLRLAFSGIHVMSDNVFDVMDNYARTHGLYAVSDTPRFPVMDFYLDNCHLFNIYGVCAEKLNLIDVGKMDTLQQAEAAISSLEESRRSCF